MHGEDEGRQKLVRKTGSSKGRQKLASSVALTNTVLDDGAPKTNTHSSVVEAKRDCQCHILLIDNVFRFNNRLGQHAFTTCAHPQAP